MPPYGEPDYWDTRYKREPACFEFYLGWPGLSKLIMEHLRPQEPLLQVGVGTSRLQEEMVKAGFSFIDNVDISPTAIAHLQELHKGIKELTYKVADVKSMPEKPNHSYWGILDKGCLDAVLCSNVTASPQVMTEYYRLLMPCGTLLLVSYGEPVARLSCFQSNGLDWSINVYVITKPESQDNPSSMQGHAIMRGPFPATDEDAMCSLSALQGVHYVYICKKPALEESLK